MTLKRIEEEAIAKRNDIRRAILSGDSSVRKFYEDAVVFMTGGSGFLGKHLIQKILSSTNVSKIYILLRSKKGKTIHERLKIILSDPVFELLQSEQPDFINKLIPIEGDSAERNLGLDEKTWTKISDEVNIIFHAAATVNFREAIKIATLTNVRSTREILKLAKESNNIKAIVHVSTAYVHATKSRINEITKEDFYTCPITPDTIIDLAETFDNETLEKMLEPIMEDWPNTYTLTKSIAEELVRAEAGNLPISIVRPAVVVSAYREPIPGWIDVSNVYGPSGVIVAAAMGFIHTFYANGEVIVDYVPVDIVNNAIIVAAWDAFDRYLDGNDQAMIYTVTGCKNGVKYKEVLRILRSPTLKELVPSKAIWYCCGIVAEHKPFYTALTWIFHYLPAFVVDTGCLVIGQKPRFFKLYKLTYGLSVVYNHFLSNSWLFDGSNTSDLYNRLTDADKIIYNCEMSTITDMEDLFFTWTYGLVKYIIKDDFNKNQYAIRKQLYFKIAHYILFPLYLFSLYKLSCKSVSFVNSFYTSFLRRLLNNRRLRISLA